MLEWFFSLFVYRKISVFEVSLGPNLEVTCSIILFNPIIVKLVHLFTSIDLWFIRATSQHHYVCEKWSHPAHPRRNRARFESGEAYFCLSCSARITLDVSLRLAAVTVQQKWLWEDTSNECKTRRSTGKNKETTDLPQDNQFIFKLVQEKCTDCRRSSKTVAQRIRTRNEFLMSSLQDCPSYYLRR